MPTLLGRHVVHLHTPNRSDAENNTTSVVVPVRCAITLTKPSTGSSIIPTTISTVRVTVHWPRLLRAILGRLIVATSNGAVPDLSLIVSPVGCANTLTGQNNMGSSIASLMTSASSAVRAAVQFPTPTIHVTMHLPTLIGPSLGRLKILNY